MKHLFPLILLVFCFSCRDEPKPLNLRFGPEAGKTWSVTSQTISSSEMTNATYNDTIDFDFNLSLLKADSMGDRMIMQVKKLVIRRPPVKISTISKDGGKELAMDMTAFYENRKKIYDSIKDDTLTLVITNTGTLKMEDGYDRLAEKLASKTGVEEAEVRRTIRDYLNSESINDFLKSIFFYLPADDIEHRNSWVSNTIFTAMAPVKHSNMIKLDSIMPQRVSLNVTAQVAAGEEGSRYMTGTKKGNITIDKKSGLILDLKLEEESTVSAPNAGRIIRISKVVKGVIR